MRKIAKYGVYVGVFLMLSSSLAGYSKASARVTQWQGLCIPSSHVTSVQGGALGEAIAHMKTDVSTAPEVILEFSSQELAQVIPGYIPEIPGEAGTNMGSVVEIQPLKEASQKGGYAYLGQGYKDLWHLQGISKNSSVKKVAGTNLYRVTAPEHKKYNDFFELVSADLRKMGEKPVPPMSTWYIADCYQDNELGWMCHRHLFTPDFYVQYQFAKPNVMKLPALDEFFRNKLKEWRDACISKN